jgi:hypothetical protein
MSGKDFTVPPIRFDPASTSGPRRAAKARCTRRGGGHRASRVLAYVEAS